MFRKRFALAPILTSVALALASAQALADESIDAVEAQVAELINAQRSLAGLSELGFDYRLNIVADQHSADMALNGCFQHDSCDGTNTFDRILAVYPRGGAMGEIIAAGYRDAASVVDAWMNSPGHRDQILGASFTALGVGLVKGGTYGTYWTVDFGALPPVPAVPEPGVGWLAALGLVGVALSARRCAGVSRG